MSTLGRIENFKIEVEERRILRLIGYKKKENEINSTIKNLIISEKKKLASLMKPASIYTILDYEETNKHPVFVDALASEAAGEVARQSDRILAQKARELNLWPSKRFSPGYKPWPLKEQQFIFRALPPEEIGVKLNPTSWMMIPCKSTSFRINFYSDKNLSTRKKH